MILKTRTGRLRDEAGAVATIVVVLLASGVLLGFTAIAVDVGRTVVERRELQNGADAGALSLAQSCAQGNCIAGADGVATLVSSNAADGEHTIVEQCDSAELIGACSSSSVTDITQCPPLPAGFAGIKYVEVRTRTNSGGDTSIPNVFGAAAGGTATSTVDTCARAGWGPPKSGSVIPVTFSHCEYLQALATGEGTEIALAFKYKPGGKGTTYDPCPGQGQAGMDAPGAFGALEADDCVSTIDAEGWVPVDTGAPIAVECFSPGDTVLIPIFNCVDKEPVFCNNDAGGDKTKYHIDGLAAFYVTGYHVPGTPKGNFLPGGTYPTSTATAECGNEATNSKFCLFGWFLEDYVDPSGEIDPGGTDYGVTVVQPLG